MRRIGTVVTSNVISRTDLSGFLLYTRPSLNPRPGGNHIDGLYSSYSDWTCADARSNIIDGDYDDIRPDGTLGPSESLDSDQVRNDDGDIVVDAPLRWISPEDNLTLNSRLAAEEPEFGYTDEPPPWPRRHRGQISGSPSDGSSFYTVAREEYDQDDEDGG